MISLGTVLGAAIPGTGISLGAVVTTAALGTLSGVSMGIGVLLVVGAAQKAQQAEKAKDDKSETENVKVKDVKSKKVKKILDKEEDVATNEEVES